VDVAGKMGVASAAAESGRCNDATEIAERKTDGDFEYVALEKSADESEISSVTLMAFVKSSEGDPSKAYTRALRFSADVAEKMSVTSGKAEIKRALKAAKTPLCKCKLGFIATETFNIIDVINNRDCKHSGVDTTQFDKPSDVVPSKSRVKPIEALRFQADVTDKMALFKSNSESPPARRRKSRRKAPMTARSRTCVENQSSEGPKPSHEAATMACHWADW
jgi:hypothetical protein